VVLAYMLTVSSLMLSIGRLGDMLARKKLYLAGIIIFTIGSALCGLSPTIYWLIGFRVLQAVGSSILMALGTAMVTEAFPTNERGKALGIFGTLVSMGIIAGPTIGGLLLESLSWHWLFFVNLPVGLVGVYLVIRFVPANRPGTRQHFDFPGALTLFLGLCALLLALSLIQGSGFSQPLTFVLLAAFAIMLVIFIRLETHAAADDRPLHVPQPAFLGEPHHRILNFHRHRRHHDPPAALSAECARFWSAPIRFDAGGHTRHGRHHRADRGHII